MQSLHNSHLFRALQSPNGDWKPTRIAYVAKGNGEIINDVVVPTSITNHGNNVQVTFTESQERRTLKSSLIMLITSPQDPQFKDPTRIVLN